MITLTWSAPTNDGGSAIVRYEVQKWDDANRQWDPEANVPAVRDQDDYSHADEGLEANTRYYYVVRAMNSVGAGPWTEFVTGDTDLRRSGRTGCDGDPRQHEFDSGHLDRA